MIFVSNGLKVGALVLAVELSVLFVRVAVDGRSVESGVHRLSNVVDERLQVSVVVEHRRQTRSVATRLVLELVVDDRPEQERIKKT